MDNVSRKHKKIYFELDISQKTIDFLHLDLVKIHF